jgi:hypothetical protein
VVIDLGRRGHYSVMTPKALLLIPLLALAVSACTIYTDDGDRDDAVEGSSHGDDAGNSADAGGNGIDGGLAGDAGYGTDAGSRCAAIADEAVCIVTPDCGALYRGDGCACQMGGCSCSDYLFVACD